MLQGKNGKDGDGGKGGVEGEVGEGGGVELTSGQRRAASTRTGMKETCPSTVKMTESPNTNSSLLRPHR